MIDRTCTFLDMHRTQCCTECSATLELCQCVDPDVQALERLTSPDGIVITMVRGELEAARKKSPNNLHQLVALMEEVGELAQAMMHHDTDGSQTIQMVLRKCVQVASMAVRVATEGDENFAYLFPMAEEDLPRGPVSDVR